MYIAKVMKREVGIVPLSQRVSVGVKRYRKQSMEFDSISLNKASELRTDCIGFYAETTMGVPITAPEYRNKAVLVEFYIVRYRRIKVVTRVIVSSLSFCQGWGFFYYINIS